MSNTYVVVWLLVGGWLLLIEFVVEKEVRHPLVVGEPAFVGVRRSDVRGLGDDDRGFLIGDVHDGQGILAIVEARFLV